MRYRNFALGCAAIGLSAAVPASASVVTMTGRVPTICQLADSHAFSSVTREMTATLTIFCNSSMGAIVSASLISGDADGYRFTLGGASFDMLPGDTANLINLTTAFHGQKSINIAAIDDQDAAQSPVVMFEILAE